MAPTGLAAVRITSDGASNPTSPELSTSDDSTKADQSVEVKEDHILS